MNAQPIKRVIGNASLVRPKYSPGLLLEDGDLTRAVDYTGALNSLLLHAMLGAGVLCGLKVEPELTGHCLRITVRCGVAVDSAGALVELANNQSVDIEIPCGKEDDKLTFFVVILRTERSCGSREIDCSGHEDDSSSVATQISDGFRISVFDTDLGEAWSRKQTRPNNVDCLADCHGKGKPLLLARIIYENREVRAEHNERSYVRPKPADDPLPPDDPKPPSAANAPVDQAQAGADNPGAVVVAVQPTQPTADTATG